MADDRPVLLKMLGWFQTLLSIVSAIVAFPFTVYMSTSNLLVCAKVFDLPSSSRTSTPALYSALWFPRWIVATAALPLLFGQVIGAALVGYFFAGSGKGEALDYVLAALFGLVILFCIFWGRHYLNQKITRGNEKHWLSFRWSSYLDGALYAQIDFLCFFMLLIGCALLIRLPHIHTIIKNEPKHMSRWGEMLGMPLWALFDWLAFPCGLIAYCSFRNPRVRSKVIDAGSWPYNTELRCHFIAEFLAIFVTFLCVACIGFLAIAPWRLLYLYPRSQLKLIKKNRVQQQWLNKPDAIFKQIYLALQDWIVILMWLTVLLPTVYRCHRVFRRVKLELDPAESMISKRGREQFTQATIKQYCKVLRDVPYFVMAIFTFVTLIRTFPLCKGFYEFYRKPVAERRSGNLRQMIATNFFMFFRDVLIELPFYFLGLIILITGVRTKGFVQDWTYLDKEEHNPRHERHISRCNRRELILVTSFRLLIDLCCFPCLLLLCVTGWRMPRLVARVRIESLTVRDVNMLFDRGLSGLPSVNDGPLELHRDTYKQHLRFVGKIQAIIIEETKELCIDLPFVFLLVLTLLTVYRGVKLCAQLKKCNSDRERRDLIAVQFLLFLTDFPAALCLLILTFSWRCFSVWSQLFDELYQSKSRHMIIFESFTFLLIDIPFILLAPLTLWRFPMVVYYLVKLQIAQWQQEKKWQQEKNNTPPEKKMFLLSLKPTFVTIGAPMKWQMVIKVFSLTLKDIPVSLFVVLMVATVWRLFFLVPRLQRRSFAMKAQQESQELQKQKDEAKANAAKKNQNDNNKPIAAAAAVATPTEHEIAVQSVELQTVTRIKHALDSLETKNEVKEDRSEARELAETKIAATATAASNKKAQFVAHYDIDKSIHAVVFWEFLSWCGDIPFVICFLYLLVAGWWRLPSLRRRLRKPCFEYHEPPGAVCVNGHAMKAQKADSLVHIQCMSCLDASSVYYCTACNLELCHECAFAYRICTCGKMDRSDDVIKNYEQNRRGIIRWEAHSNEYIYWSTEERLYTHYAVVRRQIALAFGKSVVDVISGLFMLPLLFTWRGFYVYSQMRFSSDSSRRINDCNFSRGIVTKPQTFYRAVVLGWYAIFLDITTLLQLLIAAVSIVQIPALFVHCSVIHHHWRKHERRLNLLRAAEINRAQFLEKQSRLQKEPSLASIAPPPPPPPPPEIEVVSEQRDSFTLVSSMNESLSPPLLSNDSVSSSASSSPCSSSSSYEIVQHPSSSSNATSSSSSSFSSSTAAVPALLSLELQSSGILLIPLPTSPEHNNTHTNTLLTSPSASLSSSQVSNETSSSSSAKAEANTSSNVSAQNTSPTFNTVDEKKQSDKISEHPLHSVQNSSSSSSASEPFDYKADVIVIVDENTNQTSPNSTSGVVNKTAKVPSPTCSQQIDAWWDSFMNHYYWLLLIGFLSRTEYAYLWEQSVCTFKKFDVFGHHSESVVTSSNRKKNNVHIQYLSSHFPKFTRSYEVDTNIGNFEMATKTSSTSCFFSHKFPASLTLYSFLFTRHMLMTFTHALPSCMRCATKLLAWITSLIPVIYIEVSILFANICYREDKKFSAKDRTNLFSRLGVIHLMQVLTAPGYLVLQVAIFCGPTLVTFFVLLYNSLQVSVSACCGAEATHCCLWEEERVNRVWQSGMRFNAWLWYGQTLWSVLVFPWTIYYTHVFAHTYTRGLYHPIKAIKWLFYRILTRKVWAWYKKVLNALICLCYLHRSCKYLFFGEWFIFLVFFAWTSWPPAVPLFVALFKKTSINWIAIVCVSPVWLFLCKTARDRIKIEWGDKKLPPAVVVLTKLTVEFPGHGVILKMEGTKPADFTFTQATLDIESPKFWTGLYKAVKPAIAMGIRTVKATALPLEICPDYLNPADFKHGYTEFNTRVEVATDGVSTVSQKLTTYLIRKRLQRIVDMGGNPSIFLVIRFSQKKKENGKNAKGLLFSVTTNAQQVLNCAASGHSLLAGEMVDHNYWS